MTDKKIDSLTPEQEAMMPQYVEKYNAIGLNTDPIDFDKAVEVIKVFLEDPKDYDNREFVYCESPADVPTSAKVITHGNMDSYWVSYYKFFNDNFAICPDIEEMVPVIENCAWVLYDDEKIYVVNRPCSIKFDDQNRGHSETGPAIAYSDGFSVYVWHGMRVPKSWIMEPESLTEKEFLHHDNAEMRRVASEIVGWAVVLEKLGARTIDEDADPEIGTLLEVDIPEIGKERFLKVLCGTKREFAMPVPPTIKTAIEGQAWMLGFDDVNEFMPPEIRT